MDHMIAGQIANIRQSLPREQRILLNRLLDDINSADSEVFEEGFFWGYKYNINYPYYFSSICVSPRPYKYPPDPVHCPSMQTPKPLCYE